MLAPHTDCKLLAMSVFISCFFVADRDGDLDPPTMQYFLVFGGGLVHGPMQVSCLSISLNNACCGKVRCSQVYTLFWSAPISAELAVPKFGGREPHLL